MMIKNNSGMAALLTVLIMAAAIFIFSFGSIFFSLADMEMGFDSQKGTDSFYASDGCLEEAMRRVSLDETFSSTTLNFGNFSCIINVSSVGVDKTIVVTGLVENYFKKIQASVTVSGTEIILNNWAELGN